MDRFSRKDSKSNKRCDSQPKDMMPDVGFTFSNLPQDLCTTQLARFVRLKTLPRAIRIKKNFAVKGSPIVLENGECLLLCFGVKLDRVHASLSKKNEYRLPLNAIQLYERLPLDPLLDDKYYKGTKAVIEASPLPETIRVVDAEYSPDPMADQDAGDIIKVRRVEVQEHPERGRERVLVGYDSRDKEVNFSEAMDMASYSTMISQDLLPLSELVKFDMPQRVRMPEATTNDTVEPKRNKAKEKVMKLHRLYTDYHVIAARGRDDDLLSIPINSSIEFEVVNATLEDMARVLPAIFNRTNSTWGVSDITQPRMPDPLCAVPQPIEGVFEAWAKSYEGKKRINRKYEVNANYMKKKIEERDKEIRQLKKQIEYPTASPRPALTSRPTSVPGVLPPRPPRDYRTLEPSMLTSAKAGLNKPKPLPRPKPKSSPYDTLPIKKEPVEDEEKRKLQATIQQLKTELFEKETKIFDLLNAEGKQKERYEMLRKEKDGMLTSRAADRKQILQLQTEIDRMHSIQDGALYEELDEVVSPPSLYSNPYTGMKVDKKMTIPDVCDFLRQIGLSEYVGVFTSEKIDGLMLQHLDEDIMTSDLSMRRLDARRLVTKMKQLK
eukprot:XP_011677469.1 PREDICTED: uncharacterized protein LOC752104 isoform X2 [Strongylocentrotus purpuratus]